jgi:hypothetical protein
MGQIAQEILYVYDEAEIRVAIVRAGVVYTTADARKIAIVWGDDLYAFEGPRIGRLHPSGRVLGQDGGISEAFKRLVRGR